MTSFSLKFNIIFQKKLVYDIIRTIKYITKGHKIALFACVK